MAQRFAVLPVARRRINEAVSENVALGNSREPPAFTFAGQLSRYNKYREGRKARTKAAPLQAVGSANGDPRR